jgi:hypothetical protein
MVVTQIFLSLYSINNLRIETILAWDLWINYRFKILFLLYFYFFERKYCSYLYSMGCLVLTSSNFVVVFHMNKNNDLCFSYFIICTKLCLFIQHLYGLYLSNFLFLKHMYLQRTWIQCSWREITALHSVKFGLFDWDRTVTTNNSKNKQKDIKQIRRLRSSYGYYLTAGNPYSFAICKSSK